MNMKYTITTPLYYVNDKPHLGSSYTTIACDAMARFQRLNGNTVLFITGVDEHGQKIERTAQSKNLQPQLHCDEITEKYKHLWDKLNISYDRFVRTTSEDHISLVHQFYSKVLNSDDVYMGRQSGWYCVGCEEYKEVDENHKSPFCSIHKKELEWRDEENLFFKLSKYQNQIEQLIQLDGFISPKSRKNEIINFVSKGLRDFSISRVNLKWGINVPGHKDHTFYVWFDALLGYVSGSLLDQNSPELTEESLCNWPANIHVIGKDILRFHAIYWPAMLLSAGIKIPKSVFGHGFLTREGQKMGKSLGNVLDPIELLEYGGIDAMRWYLLRDIEFGEDGDFQMRRFVDIVNSDLSNTIGNLLNRTITMSKKWFKEKIPIDKTLLLESPLKVQSQIKINEYIKSFEDSNFKNSANAIIDLANTANLYLNDRAPWKLIKDIANKDIVALDIYSVLESCRIIGILLNPFVPDLSNRILNQLKIDSSSINFQKSLHWGLLDPDNGLQDPCPVMDKIEFNENSI
ncbi:methionine--tRNA ligase [Prochlorococcus marinus]|uniref:methionine--tRNA ligase n=1 Tax=Prochlorococcus marinus TaxID=1219 RepID=UPI0022B480DC|nr:methionine--tRNA ligase [Prochlorococcus marinus]